MAGLWISCANSRNPAAPMLTCLNWKQIETWAIHSDMKISVQSLAMQDMAESSYKRLIGKPRDSGGQQQESTSNNFDWDKVPDLDRATVPYDDFGWVAEATPDWVKEDSAIFVDIDQVSLAVLQARHCHCMFSSQCLIDRWTEGLRVHHGADKLIA